MQKAKFMFRNLEKMLKQKSSIELGSKPPTVLSRAHMKFTDVTGILMYNTATNTTH